MKKIGNRIMAWLLFSVLFFVTWPLRSEVRPAGKITSLKATWARVTDVSLGAKAEVLDLAVYGNSLPLSSLYKLLQHQPDGAIWNVADQNDTAYLLVGGLLDLRKEMNIGGVATEWHLRGTSGGEVSESVYSMQNGQLRIQEVGDYELTLTNAQVTDADGHPIVFCWGIRVSLQPEVIVLPAGKITSFDCNVTEQPNRLTALTPSTRLRLSVLSVSDNHLPLSSLYQLILCQAENATYTLHPQRDTVQRFEGGVLDLRKELTIGGTATVWRLTDAAGDEVPETVYTLKDGRFQIFQAGAYLLTLTNAQVTDKTAGQPGQAVTFTYEIEVLPLVIGPRDGRITAFVCNGTSHGGDLLGLDVSDCESLQHLDCDSGRLTILDVARNPNLSVLSCRFNRLDYTQVMTISRQMQAQGAESYLFYPQEDGSDTLNLGEPLDLSDYVPVLDGVAGGMSLTRYGETMQAERDYMVDGDSLYVVRGGAYRLSVWHEGVVEKNEERRSPYVACWDLTVNGDTAYPSQPPVENPDTVEAPVFWPQKDTLFIGEKITLTCTTDSALIYYRYENDTALMRYVDGIYLDETGTLRAMAVRPGWVPSPTVTKRYVVTAAPEIPTEPEEPTGPELPEEPIVEGVGVGWIWMARAGEEKAIEFKGTGKGFRVDWGDGDTTDAKGVSDATKDSEKKLQHRYMREGSYTVKLDPMSANGRITDLDVSEGQVSVLQFGDVSMLQELDCSKNSLKVLDLEGAVKLKGVKCRDNLLTELDLSSCDQLSELDCEANRLTDLRLPSHASFKEVKGQANRMRLSVLYGLLSERVKNASYAFNPQSDSITLAAEAVLDLSAEMQLGGRNTTYTVLSADTRRPVDEEVYTETGGLFRFNTQGGHYMLYMENAQVTDYAGDKAGYPVAFTWYVSVSGVRNELAVAGDGWAAKVYVRARTVYLTEDLGEVEVYTASGLRVFHGYSRAIDVPLAGLYIVRAVGHEWKVVVP